ncbi:uncharacterized protein TRAVEDRAFT_170326 [Trametes versicolor FP-101664 SS1]|uniref:uncharacterized protein n=1 Tax=Trametes versicolor (strain FP-101664) TaxID=717944 RepID=UPI0004621FED|nr:uncharacterized protein TRAVEDRAFT_170326 [Trametes versicolor FP-101664 SS1]EIW56423.1 hypothetical protein TRAVEDRAFT_170326 [Trametes versicolor FP-101664 SS1]
MSTAIDLDEYLVPGTSNTYYIPEFVTEEEEEFLIRKIHEAPQPWWKRLANRRLQIWGGDLTAKKALIPQDMPPFVNQYPDIVGRIRETGAFKGSAHHQPNHIIMNEYAPGQGIMPHEDGPAYHPVVATLSLGSHTVFHYYKYRSDDSESGAQTQSGQSAGTTTAAGPLMVSGAGKPIDPTPVLSLLLEPRSLVITTSSLYTAHLHGIDELLEDKFVEDGRPPQERIANFDMLREGAEKAAVASGGILERGMRFSLTCRDVEKVHAGGGALFKKLRG